MGDSGGDERSAVAELFQADHKDLLLVSFYSSVLKFADGGAEHHSPTKCATAEIVVDWLAYGAVVVLYIIRHFVLKKSARPLWFRLTRCLLFACFLLATHSQPISCSLSSDPNSDELHTLSYVQGAAMMILSFVTTHVLVKNHIANRSSSAALSSNAMVV